MFSSHVCAREQQEAGAGRAAHEAKAERAARAPVKDMDSAFDPTAFAAAAAKAQARMPPLPCLFVQTAMSPEGCVGGGESVLGRHAASAPVWVPCT